MIIAGIDAGVEKTKAVIMDDGRVIGTGKTSTGGIDRPEQILRAYSAALESAGITADKVELTVATGKGKYDADFVDKRFTEPVAAAHAAAVMCPEVGDVLSLGADEVIAVALGKERLISEFVQNEKCAAGLGTFLRVTAERLELSLEELSQVSLDDTPAINDGCAVFAELDVLSLLCAGAEREKIAGAAIKAAALRAAAVYNDLTSPNGGTIAAVGGLTKNAAFMCALGNVLNRRIIVPESVEYACAIGAAAAGVKGLKK